MATHYDLASSGSVYTEVIRDAKVIGGPLQLLGILTNHALYYNSSFPELNLISFPRNTSTILESCCT